MDLIRELQEISHQWRVKNFPTADATQQLLGVMEEVGELSHAHLKGMQGIRGMADEVKRASAEMDAVGDIVIYLMGFCSYKGYDLNFILQETWDEVSQRNWVENTSNGIVNERAAGAEAE